MRTLKRKKRVKVKKEDVNNKNTKLEETKKEIKEEKVEDKKSEPKKIKKEKAVVKKKNHFEEIIQNLPEPEIVPLEAEVILIKGRSDVFGGYNFKRLGFKVLVKDHKLIKRFQKDPNFSVKVIKWGEI